MNLLELSNKQGVYIDSDDVEKFGHLIATINPNTYYITVGLPNNKVEYLHRLILNAAKGEQVDHKDGNGCNNSKSNIRLATKQQNASNRAKNTNNTSGYKGVYKANRDRWRARITVSGKLISLGTYTNIISAAKAYNKAALKYHGEFARVNII